MTQQTHETRHGQHSFEDIGHIISRLRRRLHDVYGEGVVTTTLDLWDDGDFQVTAFHTMSLHSDGQFQAGHGVHHAPVEQRFRDQFHYHFWSRTLKRRIIRIEPDGEDAVLYEEAVEPWW